MSRSRLYCPALTAGMNPLPAEEVHHAAVTLRLKPDDEVVLFDGQGGEGVGRVRRLTKRQVEVEVPRVNRRPFAPACRVTLAVAMPKAHRQGYLIEKCTELGVAAVWPIVTEYSVVRPRRAAVEKWRRRAVEAAKQCGRSWLPQIIAPQGFAESVGRVGEFASAAMMDPAPSVITFDGFLTGASHADSLIVWVGPEGGWSEAERRQAGEAEVIPAKFGSMVLRTETAAVAVCAAVVLRRWGS